MDILIGRGSSLSLFALSTGGRKLIGGGAKIIGLPNDYFKVATITIERTSFKREKGDARSTAITVSKFRRCGSCWDQSIVMRDKRLQRDQKSIRLGGYWSTDNDIIRVKLNGVPPHFLLKVERHILQGGTGKAVVSITRTIPMTDGVEEDTPIAQKLLDV